MVIKEKEITCIMSWTGVKYQGYVHAWPGWEVWIDCTWNWLMHCLLWHLTTEVLYSEVDLYCLHLSLNYTDNDFFVFAFFLFWLVHIFLQKNHLKGLKVLGLWLNECSWSLRYCNQHQYSFLLPHGTESTTQLHVDTHLDESAQKSRRVTTWL